VAGVEEGASGRLSGAGRRVVILRSRWDGQRERSGTSGKQLLGSESPAAAESGENPAQPKVEVGVGGRSAAPGALAKLLQGWPGWWHGGAASSRRRRGSARRGKARWAELGFCGRRVRWMGAGGSVAVFIGRRSALGVRARAGNHGEIPGRELRCAGKTELPCGAHGSAAGHTASGLSGRRGRRAGVLTCGPRRSVGVLLCSLGRDARLAGGSRGVAEGGRRGLRA